MFRDPRCAAPCAPVHCASRLQTAVRRQGRCRTRRSASAKRLNIQTGGRVTVEGHGRRRRAQSQMQIQRRGALVTLDRDRTNRAAGVSSCAPGSCGTRYSFGRASRLTTAARPRLLGRQNVYRSARALVVRPGPVRQQAGLRRDAARRLARRRPTSRCRAARR